MARGAAIVIVQARTTSARLPRKVLIPIGDRPMVLHVLERAALIGPPVVLATSSDPADDELAALVSAAGYEIRRGSRDDVLDRFVEAMPERARYVVRVTADCPFFDPAVGRAILAAAIETGADLVTNTLPPTFPDGLDCWAVAADALRTAWSEAVLPSDREHVLPFIWRQPERFRVLDLAHVPNLSVERWTVDDERDLTFAREVHQRLSAYPEVERRSFRTVLHILDAEPHLRSLNGGTVRDAGYARSLAEDDQRSVRLLAADPYRFVAVAGERELGRVDFRPLPGSADLILEADFAADAWDDGCAAIALREALREGPAAARVLTRLARDDARRERAFLRAGFRPEAGDDASVTLVAVRS